MIYAFLLSLLLTVFAAAQPGKMAGAHKFTSAEGRFSIALPTDTAQFEELKPDPEAPKASGGKYSWVSDEGVVTIDYVDDPGFVIKSRKDYADLARGLKDGVATFGGRILSENIYRLGRYRGYAVKFEDKDKLKGQTRMLVVNGRVYTVFGLGRDGVKGADRFIAAALDSFRLTKR